MSAEVAGIKLDSLAEPMRHAIREYQYSTHGFLFFNPTEAVNLELTPEKPNSARSKTIVKDYVGDPVGELFVIAFKPQDGTGDESTFNLDQVDFNPGYPRAAKTIPRSKSATHTEVFLPILSHKVEDRHVGPNLFYAILDLLGIDEGKAKPRVTKLGEIGDRRLAGSIGAHAVYTTGFRNGERFGDPHAIFNSNPDIIVVGGFLAVTQEVVNKKGPGMLDSLASLHPFDPNWVK